jgi:hypothetical protein
VTAPPPRRQGGGGGERHRPGGHGCRRTPRSARSTWAACCGRPSCARRAPGLGPAPSRPRSSRRWRTAACGRPWPVPLRPPDPREPPRGRRRSRRPSPRLRRRHRRGTGRAPARPHRGHAHVPGKLSQHLAGRPPLRGRGGGGDVLHGRGRLLHGVGQRARGRLRAAAPAAARQDGRARARHHQVRRPRVERGAGPPDRRGGPARAAGAPGPLAAVRVRQHPPRQHPHRGRAVAEAGARGGGRARGLGG